MEQELADLTEPKIGLFNKRAVEQSHNLIRRREILNTAGVVYVSRRNNPFGYYRSTRLVIEFKQGMDKVTFLKVRNRRKKYRIPF